MTARAQRKTGYCCDAWAGIGLGIALDFLRQGDRVVLSSRSVDKLRHRDAEISEFLQQGSAYLHPADLSKVRLAYTSLWVHSAAAMSADPKLIKGSCNVC